MALRIGWFSTGRDQAAIDLLQTIIKATGDGTIKLKIAFVFSNRVPGKDEISDHFFDVVRASGIPLVCLSSKQYQPFNRIAFDRDAMTRLSSFNPDLVVLAGYMLIVGQEMCQKYKMINLHPALPGGPIGTWQEVITQLIDKQAPETGAMMHLVTPQLDKGPPISYFSFPIKNHDFEEIRAEGVRRELPLILFTIKEFADGKLVIKDQKVYADGKLLDKGYDLTKEINQWLRSS